MRVLAAEVLRGESRRFRLDRDSLDFVQYTVQEYRVAYADRYDRRKVASQGQA